MWEKAKCYREADSLKWCALQTLMGRQITRNSGHVWVSLHLVCGGLMTLFLRMPRSFAAGLLTIL